MSNNATIGLETIVARNEEPVAVEVDRTVVMMSVEQGMYFGLEGTGPRIWALLDQPSSVQHLCDELMKEYDIDAEACRIEVCNFLEEMRRAQLVRVLDKAPDTARPSSGY